MDSATGNGRRANDRSSNGNRRRKRKTLAPAFTEEAFDPKAPELRTSWSSYAPLIGCVNTYPNGITVSFHDNSPFEGRQRYAPTQFHLRLRDTKEHEVPGGKFFVYKEGFRESLEQHLSKLHRRGILRSSVFYLGTLSDPFLNFHRRFEATTACLQLFERYRPKRLVVQTRSPMAIAALPTFKELEERAVLVVPLETLSERSIQRYTPRQPKISERLVMLQGLRRQGIRVNLCVSPVLPYGEYYRDAWDFAELLARYGDLVTFGSLASGQKGEEAKLRELALAKKLAADGWYKWLRPHAYRPVYQALRALAPEKLLVPAAPEKAQGQMPLFAA